MAHMQGVGSNIYPNCHLQHSNVVIHLLILLYRRGDLGFGKGKEHTLNITSTMLWGWTTSEFSLWPCRTHGEALSLNEKIEKSHHPHQGLRYVYKTNWVFQDQSSFSPNQQVITVSVTWR